MYDLEQTTKLNAHVVRQLNKVFVLHVAAKHDSQHSLQMISLLMEAAFFRITCVTVRYREEINTSYQEKKTKLSHALLADLMLLEAEGGESGLAST